MWGQARIPGRAQRGRKGGCRRQQEGVNTRGNSRGAGAVRYTIVLGSWGASPRRRQEKRTWVKKKEEKKNKKSRTGYDTSRAPNNPPTRYKHSHLP